jgi:outer membrane protein assembly factor BamB
LFASTNYGVGCQLLEVRRDGPAWHVHPAWSNRTMQTKFCSAVVRDGHAYGLDDGILECISLIDGSRRWKRGRYGHGQLLLADDLLVIQAEDGRVALVEATPEKFSELGLFQALDGRTWNYPALAGGELFVRNDRQAACYELPLQSE